MWGILRNEECRKTKFSESHKGLHYLKMYLSGFVIKVKSICCKLCAFVLETSVLIKLVLKIFLNNAMYACLKYCYITFSCSNYPFQQTLTSVILTVWAIPLILMICRTEPIALDFVLYIMTCHMVCHYFDFPELFLAHSYFCLCKFWHISILFQGTKGCLKKFIAQPYLYHNKKHD